MFTSIEKWLIAKTTNKDGRTLLAKIGVGIGLLLLAGIFILKYNLMKDVLTKAELQTSLTTETKADAVLSNTIANLDEKKSDIKENINESENAVEVLEKRQTKVVSNGKTAEAAINSIQSWEDFDKSVK